MYCPQAGMTNGFGDFGGWLDSVKSGLAAVIPSKTIVGKWAAGDTAGAASALGREAKGYLTATKSPTVTPQGLEIGAGYSPGLFGIPQNTLILAGLGLVGVLVFMRMKRR